MSRDNGFDTRPSIRVVNTMPEHPKVIGLSDAAFRALVELWCYCGRYETDGEVPTAYVTRTYKPRAIAELESAGLLLRGDVVTMHDYLAHNRSSDEIESFRQSQAESGAKGAHMRWHVPRRIKAKGCEYCQAEARTTA